MGSEEAFGGGGWFWFGLVWSGWGSGCNPICVCVRAGRLGLGLERMKRGGNPPSQKWELMILFLPTPPPLMRHLVVPHCVSSY